MDVVLFKMAFFLFSLQSREIPGRMQLSIVLWSFWNKSTVALEGCTMRTELEDNWVIKMSRHSQATAGLQRNVSMQQSTGTMAGLKLPEQSYKNSYSIKGSRYHCWQNLAFNQSCSEQFGSGNHHPRCYGPTCVEDLSSISVLSCQSMVWYMHMLQIHAKRKKSHLCPLW